MSRKKRVLFLSEASYLNTGYATYSREVLQRLFNSGKYELAELSIYGGLEDPRRASIPWKNYPNLPHTDHEKQFYGSNPIHQFGSWRFERACLDFKPDVIMSIKDHWMDSFIKNSPYRRIFSWCFTGNTPVLVSDGFFKEIQDLKIGDDILDGNGNLTRVSNISTRNSSQIVRLNTSAYGLDINTTPEHTFFVIKNKGRVWSSRKKRYFSNLEAYNHKQLEELEAGYINKGDMLAFPPVKVNIDSNIDYNQSLATLVGYFISEGTCDEYGHIRFSLHENEIEYANDIINALKKVYPNNKIEDKIVEKNHCRIIGINNTEAVKNTWSKFYDHNRFKILPKWVFNSPINFLEEVIKCMWRGDGCVVTNIHGYSGLEYFTNSKSLSISLWQALLRLGIVTNVKLREYRGNTGYRFFVYGEDAYKLNQIVDKVNTQSGVKFINYGKMSKNRSWIDVDGWLITKITKKNIISKIEKVYDIEVESDDHSFLIPYKVHNCWMPTVDAAPQSAEWINSFSDADGVLTYSDFAYKQIRKQGGNTVNLLGVASPAAAPEFRIGSKEAARQKMGINPAHQIIGTVMRNQRRKLYPDLFKAFSKFIKETNNQDVYLYCHTGYPDNGWDFPVYLIENEITSRVYFTYKCKCGYFKACKFADVVQQCPKCHNFSFTTTNVGDGLSTTDLATVYQTFDLYCQPANSEGFGIPVVEAAACGVPICCTDYSAMEDFKDTLNATPINVKAFYNELETGCDRAIVDTDHLASIFTEFFSLPVELRNIKGWNTRNAFEQNYSWEKATEYWAKFTDNAPYADWTIPPVIRQSQPNLPQVTNNQELVDWAFTVSSVDGRIHNSYDYLCLLRDINFGMMKKGVCGYFFPESSVFDSESYQPIGPTEILKIVNNRINVNNHWERARAGLIQLEKENWLC